MTFLCYAFQASAARAAQQAVASWQERDLQSLKKCYQEAHFDEYEHYNFDQDKSIHSGHSGKQRTKKEAEQNTNRHNPGGHERKIVTKLMNAEKNSNNKIKS